MDTVITTENLQKRYGRTVAVAEVTFDVRRGEIFGILGPNGAGKTTTVEILQGLRRRDSGRLAVLGLDPSRDAEELRRRTGSQLQSSALPERLRVGEAIRLFARLHQGPTDVDSVLSEWGLGDLRRRAYATLSGGEQQRLFVALALLGRPEIVFLDELTTGLDPTARRATWNLVRRVRDRGATVVLVTHFMEEAEALCDRIAIVDRGRVVALGPPGALTADSGGPVRTTFTVHDHDPSYLSAVPGVDAVTIRSSPASAARSSTSPRTWRRPSRRWGFMGTPTHLASYRSSGVLRRFRAAGVPARSLVVAQTAVIAALAIVGTAIMLVLAYSGWDVATPASVPGVVLAFAVGILAFAALGTLLGSLLPTARAAQGTGLVLFFGTFFLVGGGPPPGVLPPTLNTIAGWTPTGLLVDAIRSPWIGHGNDVTALVTLGVLAVAGGTLAIRRLARSA